MAGGVLIVGAGLAGARCAETLRAGGYEGPVTIVGAERVAPYERPALSKSLLAGRQDVQDVLLRPAGWWGERWVDLRLGVTVEHLDVRRRVALTGGRELPWDELVLATGASSHPLAHLPATARALRTLADALALRDRLGPGVRLTVVGAGLVGAEVASTALQLGCSISLVDTAPTPLGAAFGPEVGELLARRWREHGVDVHLGVRVDRAAGRSLTLSDGVVLDYDELLAAVGARPNGELLGRGPIRTDLCGRTGLPHVYACGDAAAFGGVPTGHWTAAAGQGAAVARTILGDPVPYDVPPYFWSDQFGLRLQLVGSTSRAVAVTLEGQEGSFAARYVNGRGRVVATLLANRPAEVGAARRELLALA